MGGEKQEKGFDKLVNNTGVWFCFKRDLVSWSITQEFGFALEEMIFVSYCNVEPRSHER